MSLAKYLRQSVWDEDYYEEDVSNYEGFDEGELPSCCASIFLSRFPDPYEGDFPLNDEELERLERDLKSTLNNHYKERVVMLITNNAQKQTNRILRKLGFKHTLWMEKEYHKDSTKIRIWWFEPHQERSWNAK